MLIIHTTTASKKEAKFLAQSLLESHLVACAQYHKILKLHSYDVPEIIAFEAQSHKAYEAWIHSSLCWNPNPNDMDINDTSHQ